MWLMPDGVVEPVAGPKSAAQAVTGSQPRWDQVTLAALVLCSTTARLE